MHIGLVGLGKMGGNMRERMRNAGITVIGFDRDPNVSDVESLAALVDRLPVPKVVWVMVPSGEPTRATVAELGELLTEGDVIVDGGNSRWTDDERHRVRDDAGLRRRVRTPGEGRPRRQRYRGFRFVARRHRRAFMVARPAG